MRRRGAKTWNGHPACLIVNLELRNSGTQKFQPEQALESLDAVFDQGESSGAVACAEFDLAWAQGVVREALRRMQTSCEAEHLMHVWGIFDARLVKPIFEGVQEMPYQELIDRLYFESPSQAYNALTTAKRRFDQTLREVIAEQVAEPEAVDTELRELYMILSHAR